MNNIDMNNKELLKLIDNHVTFSQTIYIRGRKNSNSSPNE